MEKEIKVRVRLIIIKQGKILLSYVRDEGFYFYIGGKVEFGETIEQACVREIKEECRAKFVFKKILYVRDFIRPEDNEHSVELYILGDIDKFAEIEGVRDSEFAANHWQAWIELARLNELDVRPKGLTEHLINDYQNGFSNETKYLGEID